MDDIDDSISSKNAQLSCKGSARHVIYFNVAWNRLAGFLSNYVPTAKKLTGTEYKTVFLHSMQRK